MNLCIERGMDLTASDVHNALRRQEERHLSTVSDLERKLDVSIEALNKLITIQADVIPSVSALKKQMEPLQSKLDNAMRELAESMWNGVGDEKLDKLLGKHMEPLQFSLESLYGFISQTLASQEKRIDLSQCSNGEDRIEQMKTASSREDHLEYLQLHLRTELQGIEKTILASIDEKLAQKLFASIDEKLTQLLLPTASVANGTNAFGKDGFPIQPTDIVLEERSIALPVVHSQYQSQEQASTYDDNLSKECDWKTQLVHNFDLPVPATRGTNYGNPPGEGDAKTQLVTLVHNFDLPVPTVNSKLATHGSCSDKVAKLQGVPKLKVMKGEPSGKEVEIKQSKSVSSCFFIDSDLDTVPYHVEDYYKSHGVCQRIARSHLFEHLSSAMVLLNALYLGVESDKSDAANTYDANWFFIVMSNLFGLYFTIELIIIFLAFEKPKDAFADGWFRFDLFLVCTMIIELWIVCPILATVEAGNGGIEWPVEAQPLRLLRMAKICRMARFMQMFPELCTMVLGLVRSLRAILSTLVLVAFMMYVWAIVLHMLMKDESKTNRDLQQSYSFQFGTMGHCLWTLLMDGVLQLDNAALVMTSLIYNDRWKVLLAGIAFTVFSLLSSLLILQMLIGLMCDIVSRVGADQRLAQTVAVVKQSFLAELLKYDDGNDNIARADLEECINSDSCMAVFHTLQVSPVFFVELANLFYDQVEVATVPIRCIIKLLLLCQGENVATVELIATTTCFLNKELVEMENRIISNLGIITENQRMHSESLHMLV